MRKFEKFEKKVLVWKKKNSAPIPIQKLDIGFSSQYRFRLHTTHDWNEKNECPERTRPDHQICLNFRTGLNNLGIC